MLELHYILETKDKEGKVIRRKKGKSKSWTQQFCQLLEAQMGQMEAVNARDTGNILRTLRPYSSNFVMTAGTGVIDYGIRAGIGITAEAITDYVLVTPIAHGTGAGQLSHAAVTFTTIANDATSAWFTVSRNFTNNSGATITVNEIGMICYGLDSGGYTRYLLIARDVITAQGVLNNQTLTVTYKIKVVV